MVRRRWLLVAPVSLLGLLLGVGHQLAHADQWYCAIYWRLQFVSMEVWDESAGGFVPLESDVGLRDTPGLNQFNVDPVALDARIFEDDVVPLTFRWTEEVAW